MYSYMPISVSAPRPVSKFPFHMCVYFCECVMELFVNVFVRVGVRECLRVCVIFASFALLKVYF